jgi:SAM-dependent methyltransferase
VTAGARRREHVRRAYSDIADWYASRDIAVWETPSPTARAVDRLLADRAPDMVLELGVGTGRYFPFFAGRTYVGVDASPQMLAKAQERLEVLTTRGFDSAELVCDDIADFLTRPDPTRYDAIVSMACIGFHVPIDRPLLRRLASRLRPGGVIFLQIAQQSFRVRLRRVPRRIVDRFRPGTAFFRSSSPRQIARVADAAGLSVLESTEVDDWWNERPVVHTVLVHRDQST